MSTPVLDLSREALVCLDTETLALDTESAIDWVHRPCDHGRIV